MGTVHKLLEAHGKQVALQLDLDRRVIEAAHDYMSDEEGGVGFLYSGFAQAALPHKKLADDAVWQIQTERVMLLVEPGRLPCCLDQGCRRSYPNPRCGSGDTDGDRASKLQHAVEDMEGDIHLGCPAPVRARAQAVTDHLLEPADSRFGPGSLRVAGGVLPGCPSVFGDAVQMAVPLRGRSLGRLARHRR